MHIYIAQSINTYLAKGFPSFHQFSAALKQWIKGSLVNLIRETKSVSKQDLLIMITCSSKDV